MSLDRALVTLDEMRQKRKNLKLPMQDFDAFMQARDADKAAIKPASDFLEKVVEFFYSEQGFIGDMLPWEKTHEDFRFREGEVTLWSGINGHGKSLVLGQIFLELMRQQRKCCIASFEMHPYKTLARMIRQALGSNKPSLDFIDEFIEWSIDRLWLYDQQGTVKSDRVISVIYYAAEHFGVKHFLIDSLMKCNVSSTDWDAQKIFVDKICTVARDTGCHVHLIAHSRKGEDEFSPPGKFDVSGHADITNLVDNVMTIWRDKRKEQNEVKDGSPDALIICDKQRNGEWEGKVGLWFNPASFRYLGHVNERLTTMRLERE